MLELGVSEVLLISASCIDKDNANVASVASLGYAIDPLSLRIMVIVIRRCARKRAAHSTKERGLKMGSNGGALELVVLALCVWGAYKGWQFMTGRNEWLDRKEPASIVAKAVCSLLFSWVFAAIAILKLILGFLGIMSRM